MLMRTCRCARVSHGVNIALYARYYAPTSALYACVQDLAAVTFSTKVELVSFTGMPPTLQVGIVVGGASCEAVQPAPDNDVQGMLT